MAAPAARGLSRLTIGIDDTSRRMTLTFPTVPRQVYEIEFNDNLKGAHWTPLDPTNGSSAIIDLHDSEHTDHRFYRLRSVEGK